MRSAILFLIAGALIFFNQSCRKPTNIGEELLPIEDLLNSEKIDTFQVITYTLPDDSVVTSQNLFYALGSLNSSVYGKTTAGFFAQVLLPTNNLTFGDGAITDSVVLTLDYAGFYGDISERQSVSIYRMLEPLESNRLYYSDTKFNTLPISLGNKKQFVPGVYDSVEINGVQNEPHLRIRLSEFFGNDIMSDTLVLENDTTFLNYLHGLYVEADTSGGHSNGIMLFDLNSTISGLTIYYHNTISDSLSVRFPLTAVKTNYFTHSYDGTDVQGELTMPATEGAEQTFVQGFGGLKTIVEIPYLENLKDVSVNKAEITFTIAGETDSIFAAPPNILFVQTDSLLNNFYYLAIYSQEFYFSIIDQSFGTDFLEIGGTLTSEYNRITGQLESVYKYNITRHVQEVIQGTIQNNGFALVAHPGNRIPNAVTLAGSNYTLEPALKPYLNITYTTINK